MPLKPNNIIQAAEVDLKRRQRNVLRHRGELSSEAEIYAFYAPHVRRARDVRHLLELALKQTAGVFKSKKKNTLLIYTDAELLARAYELLRAGG